MAAIETIFRCRIDWDGDCDTDDKITNKAHSLSSGTVQCDTTSAGPCWNAYVVFEGSERKAVAKAAAALKAKLLE